MANLVFQDDVLFDLHAHLTSRKFDVSTRDEAVMAAKAAGVDKIVDMSIDPATSFVSSALAKRYPGIVYATVGIDPQVLIPGDHYEEDYFREDFVDAKMQSLRLMAENNREFTVMIGETGIDTYHNANAVKSGEMTAEDADKSLDAQKYLFHKHLELARDLGLPVSIHSRGAEELCLGIAREFPSVKGIFHSFTGTYEAAKQVVDIGWGLGVNGIITFKNAEQLRDVYRRLLGEVSSDWSPADFYQRGVYFETDAPYLAPEPHRGEQNRPGYVKHIYDYMLTLNN